MKRIATLIAALAAALATTAACNGEMSVLDQNPEDGPSGGGGGGVHDPQSPVDRDDLTDIVEGMEIDVARVTLHRLNRAEYNNTVRDLLGDTTQPANDFPDDDFGYGFNNIADVLSLSPLHLEMYAQAAETLIDDALGRITPTEQSQRFMADEIGGSTGSAREDGWNLTSNGTVETVVTFPATGEYTIRASVRQQSQAGPDPAKSTLTLNGANLQQFDIPETTFRIIEVTTNVDAGSHAVGVTFDNDYYMPDLGLDRNLIVGWLEVDGPIGAPGLVDDTATPSRTTILTCTDDTVACSTEVIGNFAERAWRRPLTEAEVTDLVSFVDLAKGEGLGWEDGIRLALQATIVSPHFIFRVEIDEDPASATPSPLNDYELASRISYFIWSSMPDAELLAHAADGSLQNEEVLRTQVQRMINDPRSIAMLDNFATQWLFIDMILGAAPDASIFPDFDADLADAMRTETRLFFEEVLGSNAPISELLLADYTYVNERLAAHYNVTGVTGDDFQRVPSPEHRLGMLGHGGLLTSLSFGNRTSPVKRGAWVLGNLLCRHPPQAPPGVESLPTEITEGMTLREQMELHSSDPACAACHIEMDPIGFGLENFDAVGQYRTTDNGSPVDTSGMLPNGATFSGAVELAAILSDDATFASCITEKVMTYGLGRGVEAYDKPQIQLLLMELGENFGFQDLVTEIVLSPAFRMRRGGDLPTPGSH